jgi:predicted nucleic acid-binding protein
LILIDTGPLVALFDPAGAYHERCVQALKSIEEPIGTTTPVLTEAFHLLSPGSVGSQRLMDFIAEAGLTVWFLDDQTLARAFGLMIKYADAPMDLADASLVVAAESLVLRKVFTIDRKDFATYRIKRGHKHLAFQVINV